MELTLVGIRLELLACLTHNLCSYGIIWSDREHILNRQAVHPRGQFWHSEMSVSLATEEGKFNMILLIFSPWRIIKSILIFSSSSEISHYKAFNKVLLWIKGKNHLISGLAWKLFFFSRFFSLTEFVTRWCHLVSEGNDETEGEVLTDGNVTTNMGGKGQYCFCQIYHLIISRNASWHGERHHKGNL